jgi:hypothetical protein
MTFIGTANILFYTLFYCDVLTLTLPQSVQSLDLLPFLIGLFDFFENMMIIGILVQAPEISILSNFVGYATVVKQVLCK